MTTSASAEETTAQDEGPAEDPSYVIEPALAFWQTNGCKIDGAKPVPEGFSFTSETNAEWLDQAELESLLAEALG